MVAEWHCNQSPESVLSIQLGLLHIDSKYRQFLASSSLRTSIASQPQIVSVSGCPAELIPLLERSCFFQKGIEYPFRFDALSLPDMMHERWGNVFGTVSFFSQLKFLIAFLDGCSGQSWAALKPEFVKVSSMSLRLQVQF